MYYLHHHRNPTRTAIKLIVTLGVLFAFALGSFGHWGAIPVAIFSNLIWIWES